MAGALLGSVPVAIVHSFFVDHRVSSVTGVVKEWEAQPRRSRRSRISEMLSSPPRAIAASNSAWALA
jgi:hypothetical protein